MLPKLDFEENLIIKGLFMFKREFIHNICKDLKIIELENREYHTVVIYT